MQEVMRQGLYDPKNEHDACGVGFVVNIKGRKSHDIISQGLKILENLDHRGAVGADPLVGDGAGFLIQMPDALLNDWARVHGKSLPAVGRYAVAMCFLPRDASAREHVIQHFEQVVAKEGQSMVGWRDVPTDLTGLGKTVIETMPVIRQAIVASSHVDPRPERFRAQDPGDPQADPQQPPHAGGKAEHSRRDGNLYAVLLYPDGGLQGAAAGDPGRQLLPRSAKSR